MLDGNKTEDPGNKREADDTKNFKVPEKQYPLEEVAKQNKKDDPWIAVKGVIMGVTHWVDEHPSGPQALFSHIGRDATAGEFLIQTSSVQFLNQMQNLRCYTMMNLSPSTLPTSALDACKIRRSPSNIDQESSLIQTCSFLPITCHELSSGEVVAASSSTSTKFLGNLMGLGLKPSCPGSPAC